MPKEIKKHQTVLEAIRSVDIISELLEKHDGHFEHELDLEVIAYGRNYNGKKVGPYVHLLEYGAGEEVIREGDWGGNTFYVTVDGMLDVYVRDRETGEDRKVNEIPPGVSFGEMSILAGVPRNATIRVPEGARAKVLEVDRPALRLLRKLPKFGQMLDANYRKHGLGRTLVEVRQAAGDEFGQELINKLGRSARFMVYSKPHVLFREGELIDRVFFIRNGWIRRARGLGYGAVVGDLPIEGLPDDVGVDFLGATRAGLTRRSSSNAPKSSKSPCRRFTPTRSCAPPSSKPSPTSRSPTTTCASLCASTSRSSPPPSARSPPASLTARTCSSWIWTSACAAATARWPAIRFTGSRAFCAAASTSSA
jgi:CRP-like cAMP-binding protein